MSDRVAVLDTCVLVPSRLRDTLLDIAVAGLYQCRWSDDILEELQRNLAEMTGNPDGAARLIEALRNHIPEAELARKSYRRFLSRVTNDPKDRHVVAAAIACSATLIVTDNIRDFPPDSVQPHGITVQTADQFLTELFDEAPDQLLDILQRQAEGYLRPPLTMDELLQRLDKLVPTFVRLMRDAMTTRN